MDNREYFNPEGVDEQIDTLLQAGPTSKEEMRTVHDLQDLYQSDLQSLARVWKRLDIGADMETKELFEQNKISPNHTSSPHRGRSHSIPGKHAQRQGSSFWQGLTRHLGPIAAVLVAALLVGSLITALNITHVQHTPNEQQVKLPSGLYLYSDKDVTKIDPGTGKTAWRYNLAQTKEVPQEGIAKLVPSGNTLFVIINKDLKNTMDSGLVALNTRDGAILWQKKLPTIAAGWYTVVTTNGNAYAVSTDVAHLTSTILVLDASTGTTKTSHNFSWAISDIVGDSNRLYMGTDHGLEVVNAQDGKVIWQGPEIRLKQPYGVSLSVVNKVVYAVFEGKETQGNNWHIYLKAYNAQNGTLLWQNKQQGGQMARFTISGQQLYISAQSLSQTTTGTSSTYNTIISAYNLSNGHQNWSTSMPGQPLVAPGVTNGVVYFPNLVDGQQGTNYTLNALNARTGERLWQKRVRQSISFTTALANGFTYYATNDDNNPNQDVILAYKLDGTQMWKITVNESVRFISVAP